MEKDNFMKIESLFGADFAAEAIKGDMTFEVAMEKGCENMSAQNAALTTENADQATQITDLTAERDTATAEVNKLKDGADPIPGQNSTEKKDSEILNDGED